MSVRILMRWHVCGGQKVNLVTRSQFSPSALLWDRVPFVVSAAPCRPGKVATSFQGILWPLAGSKVHSTPSSFCVGSGEPHSGHEMYTPSPLLPPVNNFPGPPFFFFNFFTYLNKQKPSRSSLASFIDFIPNMNQANVCEYKFVHKIITKPLLKKQ